MNMKFIKGIILGILIESIMILFFVKIDTETLKNIAPYLIVLIGIVPTLLTASLNEINKLNFEKEKRKEETKFERLKIRNEIYETLIKSIRAFYADIEDKTIKEEFFATLRRAWLYCPDDVIQKANKFCRSVVKGSGFSSDERNEFAGEFFEAMRKDIVELKPLDETTLTFKDLIHIRA